MSRDDFAFPCADCLCNHCANNAESEDQMRLESEVERHAGCLKEKRWSDEHTRKDSGRDRGYRKRICY